MKTSQVKTFTATIYVGSRVGYGDELFSLSYIEDWLQRYCDSESLGVSITPTKFIYSDGNEPGYIVGLINYPRFPSEKEELRTRALEIAEDLRVLMGQIRVTVVFPDDTVMLGEK